MCLCCLLLNIYATFESTYKFYIEKNILVHHQILIVLPRAPNGPKKCGCRRDFSRLSETSRPRSKEFIVCSRLRDHKIYGCKCTPCTHQFGALEYYHNQLGYCRNIRIPSSKIDKFFYHSTNMSQLRSHNYSKKHENTFFSIQTSTIPYHLPIYHSSDQVHEFLRCNTVGIKLKYNATKYVTVSSKWFPLSKTISKSC